MNFEKLIKTRRTYHEFTGQSVDPGLVQSALELGLWAPNHKNTFPWKFYVVSEKIKNRLIELAVQLKEKKSEAPLPSVLKEGLKNKLRSCSHMVAIGMQKTESQFQQREDYASVACAIQNVSLYLHANGAGSKWSTGGFTSNIQTYEILGIDQKHIELVGVLLIGDIQKISIRTPHKPNPKDHIFHY